MSKELYINGVPMDLDEKESPIALTYSVNNLAEIKDRQAYTSNIFKLPATQNNRKALGFPDSSNIVSDNPYRKNTGTLVQNGVTIVGDGKAIIVSAGENIQVQLLSGIIGFFEALGDKMLNDLDLSDYTHTWSLATVINSQMHSGGYVYPVIDYGNLTNLPPSSASININYLRPATFVHTIVKYIIEQAGFIYEGDIFSDALYLSEILPFSNDKFIHGKAFNAIVAANSIKVQNTSQSFSYFGVRNDSDIAAIISFSVELEDTGNHWNGSEYTATQVINTKISSVISTSGFIATPSGGTAFIKYCIQKFSSGAWTDIAAVTIDKSEDFISGDNQLLEANVSLLVGDKIRVIQRVKNSSSSGLISGTIYTLLSEGIRTEINISVAKDEIILDQSVELEATLPNISQKDFMKDFLQRKGLTVTQDRFSNKLIFFSMKGVEENKSIAKDWTKKFVRSPKEVSYTFGNYGRRNFAYFKKDEAVPETLGSGYFDLDNENLKPEVELFTSVFAASVTVKKLGNIDVVSIGKIPSPIPSPIIFSKSTQPRILVNRLSSSPYKFSTSDTGGVAVPTISLPYFNSEGIEGLGFENAFRKYYDTFIKMMTRPFIVKRKALINESDISQLDWQIPIFDGETSEYYYLNEISEYIEGEISEVGLIKLF